MSSSPSAAPLGPPTGEQHGDVFRTIHEVAQKTLDATVEPLKTHEPMTEVISYEALKTQHAELLEQGKTSTEIAVWLGNKLNISAWKAGRFHGERKVLSTPTEEEMTRLKAFTQALGVSWTKANGGSDNHPQFLLLDAYVQTALFGKTNMTQVNERLSTFHTDWQALGEDFVAKAKYLLEKIGLDVRGDLGILTGVRYIEGDFGYSHKIYASGALGGRDVLRMGLDQFGSDVYLSNVSYARLCFLA